MYGFPPAYRKWRAGSFDFRTFEGEWFHLAKRSEQHMQSVDRVPADKGGDRRRAAIDRHTPQSAIGQL
jgi:hypothetical protein